VTFWLRLKPRAVREGLSVDQAGEFRLALHAPATEGQANAACIAFLARALRLPQASIRIVSGEKSRRKLVRVAGGSAKETLNQLRALATS